MCTCDIEGWYGIFSSGSSLLLTSPGLCLLLCFVVMSCDVIPAGKSKEAERKRINKELANIRSKFKGECVSEL